MTAATANASSRRRWRISEQTRWAFIFLLPWIIGFVIFTAGPMLATLFLSFTKYNVIRPPTLIGTENYEHLLTDRRIPLALGNTAFYALIHVPGVILISLLLAMMLLRVGRLSGFFRTVFYLPSITPSVATGALFLLLLAGNGLINRALGFVGIDGPNWLTDPDWVKPGIVMMSLWTLGSTVVIYFAALKNVPLELYEAARIDGANGWQSFRNITLPFISGAIFFTVIVNTIAALQVFDAVFAMFFGSRSGPVQNSALFYTIYLFQKAFRDLDFGYASAMAWILFLIILVITLIQVRVSRRFVFYAGDEK
ncbi:MAG TPA: sugar ABC transporter permease [Candidatus Limnocylindrales bacterium]|nr:sugar ABC transporter permease [Candidatus Limnocylindrales bacterium]